MPDLPEVYNNIACIYIRKKNFIKAEVIHWQKLVEVGDWHKARQKGLLRLEGKDYEVQDGDVILVKHS